MGQTYTRQSSYTDGDVITAAHTNDEFNQLLAAFASSTGHTHDGTTAEGGPITKLLGTSITIGDGTAGTDITVTFDGETNDGTLKWMEDEDYFEFSDDILIASTEKLQFRDTAIYINSSADGQLDLVADTEIQIAATTVDINGAVDISGNATVGGVVSLADGSAGSPSLTNTGDTNAGLFFSAADTLAFSAGGTSQFTMADGVIAPVTDSDVDLGTSSLYFKNAYIDAITTTGDVVIGGVTTFADGSAGAPSISNTGDANNGLFFSAADALTYTSGGTAQVTFADGVVKPVTDSDVDLGTSSLYFKDAYIDSITTTGNITSGGTVASAALDISGNIDVDGITNLDNTDIDGTLVVDGSNISLDSTSTLNIDNSNTSNGITIGTATSGVPISIGHSTSETTVNDNLTVTGSTTLAATSFGDANITNVGDIALDSISADGTDINIAATDNSATAFTIKQGSDAYFIVDTANSSESVSIGTGISGTAITLGHSTSEVTVADNLTVTGNLTVSGTTTQVDTVTMNAQNAVVFEGATADDHETTLTIVDPTADRTINLPNVSGTLPVLAAASTTQISSTPEELNILDGATVVVGEINALDLGSTAVGNAIASKAVILDSNKDYTGIRNFTITGELDAATLDISGAIDVAGTSNLDVVDIDGAVDMATTLAVGGVLTASAGLVINNGGTIGSASDTDAITIASGGGVTFSQGVTSTAAANTLGATSFNDADITNVGNIALDSITADGSTITITGNTTFADGAYDFDIASHDTSNGLKLGGTLVTSTAAELNILDGVTSTAAELNIVDGNTSATSTTVADADRVVLNDNGTMVQVAVTDLAAYFDDEITAMPNLVTTAATTVGALNSGSITSGFGTINNGASAITTTGVITGGTVEATTDTAAGDNAAMGYTSTEGLVLTGQGSTNDVTIKNDADADVIEIPTGTQQVVFDGAVKLTQTAITGDANRNIDLQLSNNFFVTMSANIDLTFTNAANAIGSSGIIVIKQDGTGGRSFTLKPAANVKTPANGATIVQATNANEYATISYYVAAEDFIMINYIGDYA